MRKVVENLQAALLVLVGIVMVTAVALLLFLPGVYVREAKAVRALEAAGYHDIRIDNTDWTFLRLGGCSRDDSALFEATVKNVQGKDTQVIVCAGFWKAASVRTR